MVGGVLMGRKKWDNCSRAINKIYLKKQKSKLISKEKITGKWCAPYTPFLTNVFVTLW